MKLLLDTNVLIDLVAQRQPYANSVRKLCIAAIFGDVQPWVSVQSYVDAYYVLRKDASAEAVKTALLGTLEFFVPCNTYAADLPDALQSDWPDVEDFLIAHASKHVEADVLVTRDADMAARSPIPAMTADQVVAHLEQELGFAYDEVKL